MHTLQSTRYEKRKARNMLAKCAHILQFANRKEPVREHMTGMARATIYPNVSVAHKTVNTIPLWCIHRVNANKTSPSHNNYVPQHIAYCIMPQGPRMHMACSCSAFILCQLK